MRSLLPRCSIFAYLIITIPMLSAISACSFGKATTHLSSRTPSDTPDHFVVDIPNGSATSEPAPGEGCCNPMLAAIRQRKGVLQWKTYVFAAEDVD